MNIVVDSNILMSILIKQEGVTATRFEQLSKLHVCFIHEASLIELSKHHGKLYKSSKLSVLDFEIAKQQLLQKTTIIKNESIPLSIKIEAYNLVLDIDENDTSFIATTIYLDAILWSSDKPLKFGLMSKGFYKVCDSLDIQSLLQ